MYKYKNKDVLRIYSGGSLLYERYTEIIEPMLVTPSDFNVSISSASDLEIDWGDGTIQTVKSGDDTTLEHLGLISNKYTHTYTDSYIDKTISIKHVDGESPIQFFKSDAIKTVERWYSEGYQPFELLNPDDGSIMNMAFFGLGSQLETVPNIAPPKTNALSGLFYGASAFNQPIGNWDVSNVTNMYAMFQYTSAFDQPLNNWNVSNVINMNDMFYYARAFNQPLNSWDVSNVIDMSSMFESATAFNQDLSSWCVSNITSKPSGFDDDATSWVEPKPVWGTCPSDETSTFEITDLFANNEQGFFYDPNDLSTMFQDEAGTVPVTGTGQPVGLIRDKSGNNNHAFQTASASRPILRKNAVTDANYLEFDGSNDFLRTNNINFTATDKLSLFTGVTKLANSIQFIAELSFNSTFGEGSFYLVAGTDGGGNGYTSMSHGSSTPTVSLSARNFTYPSPDVAVLSVKHDISGDLSSMRRNGVVGIEGIGDKGDGNFRSYPLFIGRRGGSSFPFNGHIYGLIGVGKLVSESETTAIENELAERVGVTINV